MAKEVKKEEAELVPLEEVEVVSAKKPKSDREARWAKHVADYKLSNPVKWASKNANGEFDEVPASFL